MWKMRALAILMFLIGAFLGYFLYTSEVHPTSSFGKFPFKLGLDLKGGSHLVYEADLSNVGPSDITPSMNALRNVIERRVNLFGVSEPVVQVEQGGVVFGAQNNQRLIVELPGVTDLTKAIDLIGKTPLLEFKTLQKGTSATSSGATYVTSKLTGRYLASAALEFDPQTSNPLVILNFNDEGSKLFAQITKANVGNVVGIFLDNQALSLPVVQEEITGGKAQITGNFTPQEARDLVRDLNYGALPVPIKLLSTQAVGASLGDQALHASVNAGIWGTILVALFLILWYRLPGLLAVVALSLYAFITLALFKLIPVTLTAAGLAGFILSIGMAVDANILIFERTKEELRSGKKLIDAILEGFHRAWNSIRDSNLSSMITALILFWLGASAVIKGFALVFGLGVIVSMFTAITVTRSFLLAIAYGMKKEGRVVKFLFGSGFFG